MKEKQYDERDAFKLDIAGGYYGRHVQAMTREKLHSKSDIAAELGHRDMTIDELLKELIETHSALCFTPDYIGSLRYEKNKAAINKALGETK